MLGERLKQERERLNLSQPALGEIASAAKRTVIDWEKGVSAPTGFQLEALAAAGVDVLYVLTGQRGAAPAAPPLKPDEAALLDNYRNTPPEKRGAIREVGAALAQPKGVRKKAG